MPSKILVVDDDAHIREVVQFALEKAGLEVIEAGDGRRALELFSRLKPDLVILDITMPEMDGLAVCREIRKSFDTPILFLSSRADEVDRVVGLEIGGDDYVTKPFSPRELVARVQVILKRARAKPTDAPAVKELRHGSVRLDVQGHAAYLKDKKIQLTATEFAILTTFLHNPERVLSRDQSTAVDRMGRAWALSHRRRLDRTRAQGDVSSQRRRAQRKSAAAARTDRGQSGLQLDRARQQSATPQRKEGIFKLAVIAERTGRSGSGCARKQHPSRRPRAGTPIGCRPMGKKSLTPKAKI